MNAGAGGGEPLAATVLICTRDRPALLGDTLRSVLAGTSVPQELLIVDQSTTPNADIGAMGRMRGCNVRYLHSATEGLSRARNIGLRAAACDVVVLLDDDMLVDAGWLSLLLAGLDGRSDVAATGRVLAAPPEGGGRTVPAAALVLREDPAVFRGPQPLDVVPGANVALPRGPVLELGGFDERLGAGTRFASADDNDMGHRLLLAGCEVRHVPAAVVLHRAWRGSGELVRLRWRYGRGKGAFYAKHLRQRHIMRRAGADVGGRLRRAVMTARGSPRTTAAELVSVAGMASGALEWLIWVQVARAFRRRG